ncbi:hypothetical protein ACFW1F_14120 [Streptomyces bungoensis]|uniref:hypothetical protein n=1 Tax=Streptomyces bungoensis TaxID=285568 RepID=UPI003423762B
MAGVAASVRPRRRDGIWAGGLCLLLTAGGLDLLLAGPWVPVRLLVQDLVVSALFVGWLALRRRKLARRLELDTVRDLLVLRTRVVREEVPADPAERVVLGRYVRFCQGRRRRSRGVLYVLGVLYLLLPAVLWVAGDRIRGTLLLAVGVVYAALTARSMRRGTARLDRIAELLGGGPRVLP